MIFIFSFVFFPSFKIFFFNNQGGKYDIKKNNVLSNADVI